MAEATRLEYLDGFDLVSGSASVVSVSAAEGEDGLLDVVLDSTVFYPRGGGQDWDLGVIRSGATEFIVESVTLDDGGVAHHYGRFGGGAPETADFGAGAEVSLEVDRPRRNANTRLHSAGHIIDRAVENLGLDWVPGRAGHYPHMSFVEYAVQLDPEETEKYRELLEAEANAIITVGSENTVRFMPAEELSTVVKHVPDNLPTNKPTRLVMYGTDFGIPCGGTHVKDVSEIGGMLITKIKSKKGVTKVSYAVLGINAPA
ncbi:alanine--tRNA ligase-related protein [Haematomicrobium sanguinis]|uniref:alanine--tRNA ligase-related protein n=1 Tax=Haematomicrobium sanguinis TaxID=479106 RepID=UPI00047D7F27|nr:alanine--tRNA ligase-related protein [Haematomicrobium sanguinis]